MRVTSSMVSNWLRSKAYMLTAYLLLPHLASETPFHKSIAIRGMVAVAVPT